MTTQSALAIVDTVVDQTRHTSPASEEGAVRRQAAFVRALIDEVDSHHPANRLVARLREQLGDELAHLVELFEGGSGVPSEVQAAQTMPIDVLVVDDDDAGLRACVMVVRSLGYPCRTARSGEEALRELEREPAAVVLSDWCMPGMSGLELCVTLSRREPRPYVILATAYDDMEHQLDGMRMGADDFLRKPLDIDELAARLGAAARLIRCVAAAASLTEKLRAEPKG